MEFIKSENKITLYVDKEEVGKIEFSKDKDYLVADHTYVNPIHRGKNYARFLVDELVKFAREEGLKIVPVCPYVHKVISDKDEYADIYVSEHDYGMYCRIF